MAEPTLIASYKATTLLGMAGGASAAALLIEGSWSARLVVGVVGGIMSAVGTPIFAPIMEAAVAWGYASVGVDVARIHADSVSGFTGFVLGLTGIDVSRWIIERVKGGLRLIKWPWRRTGDQ